MVRQISRCRQVQRSRGARRGIGGGVTTGRGLAALWGLGYRLGAVPDHFSDAALVLIGHGSSRHAESNQPVSQHAQALRERGLFAQVLEAFVKGQPGLSQALEAAKAPRVFCVPLFLAEGHFTRQVLPKRLGLNGSAEAGWVRAQRRGAQTLYYCQPVGTHARMREVVVARAEEVLARHPATPPAQLWRVTLCLVGHGTSREPGSRLAVEEHVGRIAALNRFAAVQALFIEEEPCVADCYRLAATPDMVLVPFFMSEGGHAGLDIPVLLGEPPEVVAARRRAGQPVWQNPTERQGKRVWYASSVGTHPALVEVILERVWEAARWAAA